MRDHKISTEHQQIPAESETDGVDNKTGIFAKKIHDN